MIVPEAPSRSLTISPSTSDADRRWLADLLGVEWGGEAMVTRGVTHRFDAVASLMALSGDQPVGAATYVLITDASSCELLTLNATVQRQGTGTALLAALEDLARRQGCRRVWLVTGNDNLDALRFYQRRGYRVVAVHAGAIDAARRLKPTIPVVGNHGIPLHDEIELEKRL